jgi:tricarballylate dehydrogenase
MTDQELHYNVVVVGAGNAALSAVHSAAELDVTIGVLEKAPRVERGGNSMLTGHLRFAYNNVDELVAIMRPEDDNPENRRRLQEGLPQRTKEELYDEIMLVTEGLADQELLKVHIDETYNTIKWLHSKGHDWIPAYENATTGNIVRCEGAGFGLQTRNFDSLEANPKVTFHYDTAAVELVVDPSGRISGVIARTPEGMVRINADAVVLAAGGFEANAEMRARYLGPRWDYVHNRGVPYNTGDGLRMALAIGAQPYGGWGSCHASPNDWALPDYVLPSSRTTAGEGIYTRYVYPYSIMINTEGKRFVDEADNIRALTYAKMGRAVLGQPGGKAFLVIDAKVRRLGLVPGNHDNATQETADTLEELATKLGINPTTFVETVKQYNAAIPADNKPDPNPFHMDGAHTVGIDPPKSNFAMTIDEGPFEAFVVRCGITFTFGGIRIVPDTAQVQDVSGVPMPGLYAAGEMVGGLWFWNYPSGSGMMAGATFGRLAGRSAAEFASSLK